MTTTNLPSLKKRIVVGVDGSPESLRAVDWAVWEAQQVGVPLEIVHVDIVDEDVLELLDYTARVEKGALTSGVERAQALAPDLDISIKVLGPPTIEALLKESENALMLVVGSRGLGAVRSLMLGSVSQACAARAKCPVVVIGSTASMTDGV